MDMKVGLDLELSSKVLLRYDKIELNITFRFYLINVI